MLTNDFCMFHSKKLKLLKLNNQIYNKKIYKMINIMLTRMVGNKKFNSL